MLCRRLLRIWFASFLCLAGLSCRAAAAEAEFVHLWPGWREAESFERIGEFFGGPEKPVRRIIARTHADSRAGYYFLLRVTSATALTGAVFQLQVVRPDAPDPKSYSFPVTAPSGSTVFDLGLTGEDWPGGKLANPVAFKLSLVAADGHVLAEHKSFLWEKPAK